MTLTGIELSKVVKDILVCFKETLQMSAFYASLDYGGEREGVHLARVSRDAVTALMRLLDGLPVIKTDLQNLWDFRESAVRLVDSFWPVVDA